MFKNKINFTQTVLFLKCENKQHLNVQNFMGKLSLELLPLYITTIQPPEHDLNKKYCIDRPRFKTGLFHKCIHLIYEPGQMSVLWPAASWMTGVGAWQRYTNFLSCHHLHTGSEANVGVMAMQLIIRFTGLYFCYLIVLGSSIIICKLLKNDQIKHNKKHPILPFISCSVIYSAWFSVVAESSP